MPPNALRHAMESALLLTEVESAFATRVRLPTKRPMSSSKLTIGCFTCFKNKPCNNSAQASHDHGFFGNHRRDEPLPGHSRVLLGCTLELCLRYIYFIIAGRRTTV